MRERAGRARDRYLERVVRGRGRISGGRGGGEVPDYENAYFVSARITGEGIPSDMMGTWSTNGLDGSGSVFSAESFAGEFSDWGDGPGFSSSDDGFAESRDCVS